MNSNENVYKHIFDYDYKVVDKIGKIAWNRLKTYNKNPENDHVMNVINNQLYPGHSAVTYRLSLNNLVTIANKKN